MNMSDYRYINNLINNTNAKNAIMIAENDVYGFVLYITSLTDYDSLFIRVVYPLLHGVDSNTTNIIGSTDIINTASSNIPADSKYREVTFTVARTKPDVFVTDDLLDINGKSCGGVIYNIKNKCSIELHNNIDFSGTSRDRHGNITTRATYKIGNIAYVLENNGYIKGKTSKVNFGIDACKKYMNMPIPVVDEVPRAAGTINTFICTCNVM